MIMSIEGDPSRCDHEAARLLPWLVAGALSEREMQRVQQHVADCSICAADWKREQQMQSLICDEPAVEHAPQPGLQNLLSRIDEVERELAPPSELNPAQTRSARRFGAVRWLAAAVIVQTVAIGVLGVLLWQRGVELRAPRFHTLTSAAPATGADAQIRVVFAPGMPVGEMQALLKAIAATVLAGPSDAGVYTLSLGNGPAGVEPALEQLRTHADVIFAEPQLSAARTQ